jgi:hypothetical protein
MSRMRSERLHAHCSPAAATRKLDPSSKLLVHYSELKCGYLLEHKRDINQNADSEVKSAEARTANVITANTD